MGKLVHSLPNFSMPEAFASEVSSSLTPTDAQVLCYWSFETVVTIKGLFLFLGFSVCIFWQIILTLVWGHSFFCIEQLDSLILNFCFFHGYNSV